MPATRPMIDFKVRNTEGQIVTVQRRCFGDGKQAQKQMSTLIYDEKSKKFRNPTKEEQARFATAAV